VGEIHQDALPKHRTFRRAASDPGNPYPTLFPGNETSLFSIDLTVDQLLKYGASFAVDYEGTLNEKVILEAIIEGKQLKAKRTAKSIYADTLS
jgi:hypothetical protein